MFQGFPGKRVIMDVCTSLLTVIVYWTLFRKHGMETSYDRYGLRYNYFLVVIAIQNMDICISII